MIVPASVWLIILIWGTPHVVWLYSFHDNGDPYNPLAERRYISCVYWGWLGHIQVPAVDETCPWVRFLKERP